MTDASTFAVRIERRGDKQRAIITGDVDMTAEQELVEAVAAALTSGEASPLVLDVAHVDFMDSSGLRALLVCRDAAEKRGVPVTLALGHGPVTRLLRAAGVHDWFTYE